MNAVYTGRVVWALTRAELAANAAYRWQIVLSALGWVVPMVMMVLWRQTTDDDATVAAVTTYYLATLVLTNLNPWGWVTFGLGDYVRTGQLSSLLLRPSNPIWTLVARALGRAPMRVVASAVLIIGVSRWLTFSFTFTPAIAVTTILAFTIGMVGVGMIFSMFGMIAFWTSKGEGVSSLCFAGEWLFGGLVAPMFLVDGWFGSLGRFQPFWLALGGPAELVAGARAPTDMVGPMAAGLVWAAALGLVFTRMWERGTRRHEAVGS